MPLEAARITYNHLLSLVVPQMLSPIGSVSRAVSLSQICQYINSGFDPHTAKRRITVSGTRDATGRQEHTHRRQRVASKGADSEGGSNGADRGGSEGGASTRTSMNHLSRHGDVPLLSDEVK